MKFTARGGEREEEKETESRLMMASRKWDGELWEHTGRRDSWGWWSFLGAYFLVTFCVFSLCIFVLCISYFSYPCNKDAWPKQLKEGRLYSGFQLGNVAHCGQGSSLCPQAGCRDMNAVA